MTLRLTYRGETTIPVEIEGFTTDWARDKPLAAIERFEIFLGNRKLPLAELFSVTGDPADQRMAFEGNLAGVHWIAAHMTSGEVHIHGSAGRHVGSQMRGGTVHVHGDAGDWLGAEMHGGFIHVHGHAGHLVGAAYRGSAKGVTGGMILVDGDAGHEVGCTMRRGLVAIGGRAGDMLGFNLIAGTILVLGPCGVRPGAGMRRGTLGLFGPNPPALLPSFRFATTCRPQVVPVLLREIRSRGLRLDETLLTADYHLHHGDLVALGKGEILIRA
jgi:formylmethanofuran dehydrogenase subunit C